MAPKTLLASLAALVLLPLAMAAPAEAKDASPATAQMYGCNGGPANQNNAYKAYQSLYSRIGNRNYGYKGHQVEYGEYGGVYFYICNTSPSHEYNYFSNDLWGQLHQYYQDCGYHGYYYQGPNEWRYGVGGYGSWGGNCH
jgi:hypothetical protein